MNSTPAILGGVKAFPEGISFTRPTIPAWEEVAPNLEKMYRSGWLTKGPYQEQFEKKMSQLLQVKHVVAVSSCTSGLLLALQALKLDKSKGEVIVPSFSFMATFHSLVWNGFKPVFVDCEPDTFTIDLASVEKAITSSTVGIYAACVFGNPPDWENLEKIAAKVGLPLFSDSAHGLGSTYHGKPLGGLGKFEIFSLSPTKLLPSGEGGLVATNDDDLAKWVRDGRDYGNPGTYDCLNAGINARMSEFHAIVGLAGADSLESYAVGRNQVAACYRESLGKLPGVFFQTIRSGCRSSYKDFAILIEPEAFGMDRDKLGQALLAEGIPTRAYFHPAGHQLTVYADLPHAKLTNTERISSQIICLPIESRMDPLVLEGIIGAVEKIHRHAASIK